MQHIGIVVESADLLESQVCVLVSQHLLVLSKWRI